MKHTREKEKPATNAGPGPEPSAAPAPAPRKKHHRWRTFGIIILVLALVIGIGRAMMPWAVKNYVNRTLDRNPLYSGDIGKVRIHLWRGAYSIEDVRINKTTASVPVPFFAAE